MDCLKVGNVISQLRKEKGLTQQQIADMLGITNKTVSKWECGQGCPDITLINELSKILGTDIERLLEGNLKINKTDVGKMDKAKFYVCPKCKNIVVSTSDADVSCCGRKAERLKSCYCDEMHEITVAESDGDYYITLNHEMLKEHYIMFAALVYYDSVLIVRMYPEQDAAFRIPVIKRGGSLYIYCSNHGLMKSKIKL